MHLAGCVQLSCPHGRLTSGRPEIEPKDGQHVLYAQYKARPHVVNRYSSDSTNQKRFETRAKTRASPNLEVEAASGPLRVKPRRQFPEGSGVREVNVSLGWKCCDVADRWQCSGTTGRSCCCSRSPTNPYTRPSAVTASAYILEECSSCGGCIGAIGVITMDTIFRFGSTRVMQASWLDILIATRSPPFEFHSRDLAPRLGLFTL